MDLAKYPRLAALVKAGTVFVERSEYVGRASDGELVAIGSVGLEDVTESYLSEYPTPEHW